MVFYLCRNQSGMKRIHIVIIHMVFWVTFVIIPYFMFSFGPFKWTPENYYFLIQHQFNIIVFYLAYFSLIPFILKRRSLTQMIGYSLSFIVILTLLRFLVSPYIKDALGAFQKFPVSPGRQLLYSSFWNLMYLFYAVIIYLSIEWYRERKRRVELIKEKKQSEIDLLKSQVNPHFLMNTLNNLYSLVYQGNKQADEAILKLSELMRYMLYDTHSDLVPLENEINYLKSFIELQFLRFSNKDFVKFEIDGEPAGKLIAPMLLVPFVENAFKHGNKNLPGMGISIKMNIRENQFFFQVNNIKSSKFVQKVNESGIGLKNIQKRLELQYPDRHELFILDETDTFEIRLRLTL